MGVSLDVPSLRTLHMDINNDIIVRIIRASRSKNLQCLFITNHELMPMQN